MMLFTLSSPTIKCLDVICSVLANDAYNAVSPSLGVATLQVGSHGRSLRGQRDPWGGAEKGGWMVAKESVSSLGFKTLKDWLPFRFWAPQENIKCCHCQLPGSACFAMLHFELYSSDSFRKDNGCRMHVLAVHVFNPQKNFDRFLPSSCVLGI